VGGGWTPSSVAGRGGRREVGPLRTQPPVATVPYPHQVVVRPRLPAAPDPCHDERMITPTRATSPDAVARHYDELDRYYRELWGTELHHGLWEDGVRSSVDRERGPTTALTRLIAEHARADAGSAVCDVGCGYGAPARFLAERHGAHVLGFTLSSAQLRVARASAPPGEGSVRYVLGDWLENAQPSATFDAVVAIESVSHMSDKRAFVGEARRILRPGGRLVVAAWLAAERPRAWERDHLLEPICREGRLPGLASRSEYLAWLASGGFDVLSARELGPRVRRTWSVCARRAAVRVGTDPGTWRYLLDPRATERAFLRTLVRIWSAYRLGALGYGLFTARAA